MKLEYDDDEKEVMQKALGFYFGFSKSDRDDIIIKKILDKIR